MAGEELMAKAGGGTDPFASGSSAINFVTDLFGGGGTNSDQNSSTTGTGNNQSITGNLQQNTSTTNNAGVSTSSGVSSSSTTGSSTSNTAGTNKSDTSGTSTNIGSGTNFSNTSGLSNNIQASTSDTSGKSSGTSRSDTHSETSSSSNTSNLDAEFLGMLKGLTRGATSDLANTQFTRGNAIADAQGIVEEVFRNYQENDVAGILGQMGQAGAYNSSTAKLMQDNARAVAANKAAATVLSNIKDYAQLNLAEKNAVTSLFSTLKGAESSSSSRSVTDSSTLSSNSGISSSGTIGSGTSSGVSSSGTTGGNTTQSQSTNASSTTGSNTSATTGTNSSNSSGTSSSSNAQVGTSATDSILTSLGITSGQNTSNQQTSGNSSTAKSGLFDCVVTFAVTLGISKLDECVEMQLLRVLRDEYLVKTKLGIDVVINYYDSSPNILAGIHTFSNPELIGAYLYNQYVSKIALLVASGQHQSAATTFNKLMSFAAEIAAVLTSVGTPV